MVKGSTRRIDMMKVFKQPNGLWRAQPKDVMTEPYICGHGKTKEEAVDDAERKKAERLGTES
jgi:hypothetical protein